MPEPNLCRHCFSVLEEGETVCSACGQKPEAPNPDVALPLGTVLSGQYRVGMVLHHNDLLTTYLAWDAEKDRKVRVEEFFPGILKRAEDHKGILLISAESKTLFRTMASDLHDRWKRLMEVNHKAMHPVPGDRISAHGAAGGVSFPPKGRDEPDRCPAAHQPAYLAA